MELEFKRLFMYNNIKNIEITNTFSSMCLINNDILCIIGNELKGLYLIDIYTYQIIKMLWQIIKQYIRLLNVLMGLSFVMLKINKKKFIYQMWILKY